jgi:integrase
MMSNAAKDKAVETGAGEKVVRLLRYAPTVMTSEAEVAALVGGTVSRQRQFIPTLDETAKVIDAIQHEHMFRYVIIALTTWARPSTILELDVEKQVDFRFGVVDLLPVEKRQTNKRRPIIPLVPTLRGWLEHWNTRYPVLWGGEKIVEINDAFRTIGSPMGLPKFTPYTLRHLANSEALARGGIGEERSRMLGHLPKSQAATTAWYEHGTVANYLKSCVDATESLIDDLEARCRRPLRAPKSLPQATLRLVSN